MVFTRRAALPPPTPPPERIAHEPLWFRSRPRPAAVPDRRPLRDRVEQLQLDTAGTLKEITGKLGIPFIFKSSFDKANRTSRQRVSAAPGWRKACSILAEVKRQIGVPVLTDVHEYTPMDEVAAVVDVLQTPAFLCRQTDFIQNVAQRRQAGQHQERPVPVAVGHEARRREGARRPATTQIMVCERGASFGYNNLVSDMRSLAVMRETDCPVVFDATHSVQLPGGPGHNPAASANSCRCWRARRSRSASPASSWKRIPIRTRRSATGRTRGRLERWKRCSMC